MENIYEEIIYQADSMSQQLRKTRRDLHKYAEQGWCEVRTSSLIASRLTELGYHVLTGSDVCFGPARMGLPSDGQLEAEYQRAISQGAIQPFAQRAKYGYTGVIGLLDCGNGPTVALRFDIDALGVSEDDSAGHLPNAEGFRSVNNGTMHACGHDGHTAIGLGVAEILLNLKKHLHGKIKLIFQPAEEGVRGAKSIVEHGHLDDVDYVIGNHINESQDNFQISLTTGATLSSTKMDILYRGTAAHAGASPEKGKNAMLAAATAVLNLHAIPRNSQGGTYINVGTLHAGSGRNVVCDSAKLEVEVRGETTELNAYMEDYARRIAISAGEMHGCSCEITLMGATESLESSPDMLDYCEKICREKLGLSVAPLSSKAGGSEDFAYMVNRVCAHGGKGLFFNTLAPCSGGFHTKSFDLPESFLCNGVKVFCGLTYNLLTGGRP